MGKSDAMKDGVWRLEDDGCVGRSGGIEKEGVTLSDATSWEEEGCSVRLSLNDDVSRIRKGTGLCEYAGKGSQ